MRKPSSGWQGSAGIVSRSPQSRFTALAPARYDHAAHRNQIIRPANRGDPIGEAIKACVTTAQTATTVAAITPCVVFWVHGIDEKNKPFLDSSDPGGYTAVAHIYLPIFVFGGANHVT